MTTAASRISRPNRKRTPQSDWSQAYQNHIDSPEWAVIRDQVRQRSCGLCEQCKEKPARHVHHLTYKRLGAEPLDDLLHLCLDCHQKRHPHKLIDGAKPLAPPPQPRINCAKCGEPRHRSRLVSARGTYICKNPKVCAAAQEGIKLRKPSHERGRCEVCGTSRRVGKLKTVLGVTTCKRADKCAEAVARSATYRNAAAVARDREAMKVSRRLDGLPENFSALPHAKPAFPTVTW